MCDVPLFSFFFSCCCLSIMYCSLHSLCVSLCFFVSAFYSFTLSLYPSLALSISQQFYCNQYNCWALFTLESDTYIAWLIYVMRKKVKIAIQLTKTNIIQDTNILVIACVSSVCMCVDQEKKIKEKNRSMYAQWLISVFFSSFYSLVI